MAGPLVVQRAELALERAVLLADAPRFEVVAACRDLADPLGELLEPALQLRDPLLDPFEPILRVTPGTCAGTTPHSTRASPRHLGLDLTARARPLSVRSRARGLLYRTAELRVVALEHAQLTP